jgi:hypothetical protein
MLQLATLAVCARFGFGVSDLGAALESRLNAPTAQTITTPTSDLHPLTLGGGVDARIANDPTLSRFKLDCLVPYDANDADMKPIRYQQGFNHFVSPWVVAIADPRASVDYQVSEWTALSAGDKAKLGCYACNRPAFLDPARTPGLTNVFELLLRRRSGRPRLQADVL